MNKENEKELRKNLELQTKEELIEKIIIQTRTYENALNIITNKKELIDKAIEYIEQWRDSKTNIIDSRLKGTLEILRGEDDESK